MLYAVTGRPVVIAHRGASADVAEHTLAAYELALDQGADGLECDIRLTADGHLVCVHDRRIDRTSDGWGVVSTKTLDQLNRHDFTVRSRSQVGDRWRRPLQERRVARRRTATTSEVPVVSARGRVLTLPVLLDLVTSSARPLVLAIETKHPTRYAGWVEEQLVAQLRQFGLASTEPHRHQVRMMSFSALAVRRFRQLAPGIPRVFLTERIPLSVPVGDLPFGAQTAGVDIELVRRQPEYVERVHRAGHQFYCWTVDEPEDVELCRRLGVDAIITNRPRAVLDQLGVPQSPAATF